MGLTVMSASFLYCSSHSLYAVLAARVFTTLETFLMASGTWLMSST